jgi:hypothetical protein
MYAAAESHQTLAHNYLTALQATDAARSAAAAGDEPESDEHDPLNEAMQYLEQQQQQEQYQQQYQQQQYQHDVQQYQQQYPQHPQPTAQYSPQYPHAQHAHQGYLPQPDASSPGPDAEQPAAASTVSRPPRKRKPQNGKRDTTSMNCRDCRKVRASWGLLTDMKKIWCADCGRRAHAHEGAALIRNVGSGYCEDCVKMEAKWGMPIDDEETDSRGIPVGGRASGKQKRYRWCKACAEKHPGAVDNRPFMRPEAIAARKVELEKRREARAVAKVERRKKHREEIKGGRMKEPLTPCVRVQIALFLPPSRSLPPSLALSSFSL